MTTIEREYEVREYEVTVMSDDSVQVTVNAHTSDARKLTYPAGSPVSVALISHLVVIPR